MWRRVRILGTGLVALALLAGLATFIARAHDASEDQLEDRFTLRGALGASFTSSFVASILRDERRWSERQLGATRVTEEAFVRVVQALDLRAAVLLDARGRALHVWPRAPKLRGAPLGARYPHLQRALAGHAAVSGVVPSAVRAEPVVAFAVPFRSRAGRRVFSGAFAARGTPLDAYLQTALPFAGAELFVVDARRRLVLSVSPRGDRESTTLAQADPAVAAALAVGDRGDYERDGEPRFFSAHPVAGTSWTVIATVPERQLLAPVEGVAGVLPWILFAAVVLAAALSAWLFRRLAAERARLASFNVHLTQSNDELRDLSRLKDEFVALVSHELRTPLTSIIGYVGALRRGRAGALTDDQHGLLEVVERNGRRLLGLIGDLLLAARFDAGTLELEPETVDLRGLAGQAVESARLAAEERGVTLTLSAEEALELHADRARLQQILDNLIANAIKFTPAGGRVHVRLRRAGNAVSLEVEDDGIGIPVDEQARLFERFFRASTATAREIPGSGLGLSIVKTIVELHGGTIECRSAAGEGTTFVVTLPLPPAHKVAA